MPETSVVPSPPPPGENTAGAQIFSAQEMESLERANIERALVACGGKVSGEAGAASRLGIAPSTLSSRMKALGIQRKS
jgi:transcriptional regulator with GAF, ATPase, and Fis domain